jgi:nucleoside-diphosphate-sugar epimerase
MPVSFPEAESMSLAVVTGASGFVGRALLARIEGSVSTISLGAPDWADRLAQASLKDAVIYHLAARVHHAGEQDGAEYHDDNAAKTEALARAAARAGARRLVFLSTIKVHGEETTTRPFMRDDPPDPRDEYARSKLAAERTLTGISAATGLEIAIVRSPLVYGPGPSGNLRSLMKLVASPWPLPFASLDNRRSFIHRDDLARLLVACGAHPAARGKVFLAAHPERISTQRLVRTLRHALRRPPRLFPLPASVLESLAAIGGRRQQVRRLTRSLEVDASCATEELGWSASIPFERAVADMLSKEAAG